MPVYKKIGSAVGYFLCALNIVINLPIIKVRGCFKMGIMTSMNDLMQAQMALHSASTIQHAQRGLDGEKTELKTWIKTVQGGKVTDTQNKRLNQIKNQNVQDYNNYASSVQDAQKQVSKSQKDQNTNSQQGQGTDTTNTIDTVNTANTQKSGGADKTKTAAEGATTDKSNENGTVAENTAQNKVLPGNKIGNVLDVTA